MSFRALLLDQDDGKVRATVEQLREDQLPDGDVTVAVQYSTLNYKDGLVLGGLGRLVQNYPHVPGIDFAGIVESSRSPKFSVGDRVVLTGWRVGELYWGGYAQKARVKSEWLVRLPSALSTRRAMSIGTAGLTAMLCVMALERHGLHPSHGEVAVTGAAGGVGSVAVALLARLGYEVAASTGRASTHDYLRALGAASIVDRTALAEAPKKPLLLERFSAGLDTVGSTTLASLLAQIRYAGAVAACGLAGGTDLPTTVMPFILRGVSLLGVDSVMCPLDIRANAWERLAEDLPLDKLDDMTETVGLSDVPSMGQRILDGKIRGRLVVDVNA